MFTELPPRAAWRHQDAHDGFETVFFTPIGWLRARGLHRGRRARRGLVRAVRDQRSTLAWHTTSARVPGDDRDSASTRFASPVTGAGHWRDRRRSGTGARRMPRRRSRVVGVHQRGTGASPRTRDRRPRRRAGRVRPRARPARRAPRSRSTCASPTTALVSGSTTARRASTSRVSSSTTKRGWCSSIPGSRPRVL